MLLPSDVARLVLGYLQQEKLLATCRAFISESSDLKEYAEHCTGEGFVPACLLSLFGKNLTTILNEYIAMKTKEATIDVPAMMSSLWKKLDYTLSQIRSMQNSGGFSAHQRSRTRSAIADMKKQKCLQQSASSNVGSSSVALQSPQLNSTPVPATEVILKPLIAPVLAQTRSSSSSAHQSQGQESHITTADSLSLISSFQERKLQSSVMSPGKRKGDSQKKKNVVSSGPQSSNSGIQDSPMEKEVSEPLEELIDGSFPQLVIENAREKILSSKCLQEKLAENINKYLGSDGNISQTPKLPDSGPPIQESSFDEFLGLQQGEIHMTEEAIQEILEQTESDPAFHGLFDMFDFGKTKGSKNTSNSIVTQSGRVENAVLVDEENLSVLESYIEAKEMSDNCQLILSYTGDHSKETTCVLKTGSVNSDIASEEHPKIQNAVTGEFQGGSTMRNETDSVEKGANARIIFESEQNQISGPELGALCVESFHTQETTARDSSTDLETKRDLLCQEIQHCTALQCDQLDAPQKSLSDSAECCSLLSEKANAKLLSPLMSGHSEMMKGANVASSSPLADSNNLEQTTEDAVVVLPVCDQQNSKNGPLSNRQEQDKLELDSAIVLADVSDSNAVELQLEIVDTSNGPNSHDQPLLHEPDSKHPNQKSKDFEMQESSSSTKAETDGLFLSSDNEGLSETPAESNPTAASTIGHSPPELVGESSSGNKISGSVSSSSQATDVDPSSIVALNILISDDQIVSSEAELNSAVSSITGENWPTIVLSSPPKSPVKVTGHATYLTPEEVEKTGDLASVDQNPLVLGSQDSVVSTLNVRNEQCALFPIAGAADVAKDGPFIQLMPAASSTFGNSNSVYIATCVTEPTSLSTNVSQSNLVVLPGSCASLASPIPTQQQLRTPPRTNNLFAMNPPMSPNFSQGSAIIIASPVQPVLQGMVGMIPLSIMGQNGNAFSEPLRQVLHMPVQTLCSGGVPKLPLPPRSQKIPRNKSNIGKLVASGAEPVNPPSARVQRTGNLDRLAYADVGKKLETVAVDTTSCSPKQNGSYRRVLCFDSTLPTPVGSTPASQKERTEKPLSGSSFSALPSAVKAQSSKREQERTLPRILCKPDITSRNGAAKDAQPERKGSGPGLASDMLRKQTANKENEMERNADKTLKNQEVSTLSNSQQNINLNEKISSPVQEFTKKQGLQSNANSKNSVLPSKESKKDQSKLPSQVHCLTSPLAKQTTEMLHDIQRHSPASKLPENGDLPVPRTPSGTGDRLDDNFDIIRTPRCRRASEDSATPRIMVPPATPDLPACSPASETSSENSVSMAAHTLMILSRAAIARTSTTTPLKDNTQQFRSLRSTAKKRKQEDSVECERNSRTASKKELQSFTVPIKKKKVKQKKLPISFPAGMDVDKFLLSLHYDE